MRINFALFSLSVWMLTLVMLMLFSINAFSDSTDMPSLEHESTSLDDSLEQSRLEIKELLLDHKLRVYNAVNINYKLKREVANETK